MSLAPQEQSLTENTQSGAVQTFYKGSGEWYENMMDEEIKKERYTDRLKKLSGLASGVEGPLLDVCCGSGHMLEWLATKGQQGERPLIAHDLCENFVEMTRNRLVGKNQQISVDQKKTAQFVQGDMTSLSSKLPPNSVAMMLNCFSIHHVSFENVIKTLSEAAVVAKPGGGALLLEWWVGEGKIDFPKIEGEHADTFACYYWPKAAVVEAAEKVGWSLVEYEQELEEEMQMEMAFGYFVKK